MPDEKLVLVERFEELRPGMRVLIRPCRKCGPIGCYPMLLRLRPLRTKDNEFRAKHGPMVWEHTGTEILTRVAVMERRVFRVIQDVCVDDQIASEENPYLSRSVVGTGGVDEVRVPARERR